MNQFYWIILNCLGVLVISQSNFIQREAILDTFLPHENTTNELMVYKNGMFEFTAGECTTLRLFGSSFTGDINVTITNSDTCDAHSSYSVGSMILEDSSNTSRALITLHAPNMIEPETVYYFCFYSTDQQEFKHQGNEPWKSLKVVKPVKHDSDFSPINITLLFVLLIFSCVFSGQNLGLMGLSVEYLEQKRRNGTYFQKICAWVILPLRKQGNSLLAALLISNVLVNIAFTFFFDTLPLKSKILFILLSSLPIVIVGEILPQAVFSRFALILCGLTIVFTYVAFGITLLPAVIIGKCLDCVLGKNTGNIESSQDEIPLNSPEIETETTIPVDPQQVTDNDELELPVFELVPGALGHQHPSSASSQLNSVVCDTETDTSEMSTGYVTGSNETARRENHVQ